MTEIQHHISHPEEEGGDTGTCRNLGQRTSDHFKQTDFLHRNQTEMPILPRWRFMTTQARSQTKRIAVTAAVFVVGLIFLRPLLPWLIMLAAAWWVWNRINRR